MRIALVVVLVAACTEHGQTPVNPDPPGPGTLITLTISGQLTQVDNASGVVDAIVGDSFVGTIVYESGAIDTGEGAVDSAIYRFNSPPTGISIDINGTLFETDPTKIDLLINVVDRSGADSIVFQSGNNRCSDCPGVGFMSWQLDDSTGTALTDIELPIAAPDLSRFTQLSGLSISSSDQSAFFFSLRGEVAQVTLD